MAEVNDMELMREYADQNSELAFAQLVGRHINLVYSVALRFTGDSGDAQDVTQAVFILLARKTESLHQRISLTGWLYETTRFTARQSLRTRARQQAREQEAYMQSTLNDPNPDGVWKQLAPLLEEGMARLNEKERTLLALRFFENKTGAETAALLGIQEWAAHKRVNRAVEKLRGFFAKRGMVLPAAVLMAAISANSMQAAPMALTKAVTATAFAKGATASASTLTLVKGALKIMAWSKMKTAIVAGVVVLLMTGTATMLIAHHQRVVKEEEIPRTAWKFAGYADPQSALMSFLFAGVCQSDRAAFEASLSPDQLRVYRLVIKRNMELPQHLLEAEVVADHFRRVSEGWQAGSYRILDVRTVSADQVILRIHGHSDKLDQDFTLKMKKIGSEWKYDGDKP